MKFSLVITGAPYATEAPLSAWRFAQAAIDNGHTLYRVFLHGDGVLCATTLATPARDELDVHRLWRDLAEKHTLDVVVCIASALKRGILNADESARYNQQHHNLAACMQLGGLGQMIDAVHHSDRVITFGP